MTTFATPSTRAAGNAYLRFTRSGSETVLTRSFATSPVKIFATKGGRVACWTYAATLGGGLVGGDDVHLSVDVASGARALVTTQASTKVYRSLSRARQTIHAKVDAAALLAVLPDPIVCFASADFAQVQRYELEAGASLVVVDWTTSGRHASGERWAFSRYESRLSVFCDGRPHFHDAFVLERDLDSVAERMDRFEVVLTAIITGPLVSDAADLIVRRLGLAPILDRAELIQSASRLRCGGALVRMAGVSVEQVGRALRDVFTFVPSLLGDDPWTRKW